MLLPGFLCLSPQLTRLTSHEVISRRASMRDSTLECTVFSEDNAVRSRGAASVDFVGGEDGELVVWAGIGEFEALVVVVLVWIAVGGFAALEI
jgi:hypothetical protein